MNYILNSENRLPYIFKWSNRTQYNITLAILSYTIDTFKTELQNKLNLTTGLSFQVTTSISGSINRLNIINDNNTFKIISGNNIIADYLGIDNITPTYFSKIISSTKTPNFIQILNENNNIMTIQITRDFTYTLPNQIYSSIDKLMDMIIIGMNSTIIAQNYSYSMNNNIISFISPTNPIILYFANQSMYKLAKVLGFYTTNTLDYINTINANDSHCLSYQLSDISFDLGYTLKISEIELKYISLDNNIYNIDSRNNTFKFIIKNNNIETNYTVILIDGIYTVHDYIEKLNAYFNTNTLAVTASYNILNQKISITCSNNLTIKYIDNIYTNKLLGFNNNSNRQFITVLSSDYVVNFSKKKIFFLDCNTQFGKKENTKRFLVEIGQPLRPTIKYNWNETITKLDFSLKDEFNEPINIQQNWVAILNLI
jgi:hypothetical protein